MCVCGGGGGGGAKGKTALFTVFTVTVGIYLIKGESQHLIGGWYQMINVRLSVNATVHIPLIT